jgi:asparagine synthase (glutamine-hydrolysing)
MPGVFGFIDHTVAVKAVGDAPLRLLEQMAAAMYYDPSYAVDLVVSPEAGAWVGRVAHGHLVEASDVDEHPLGEDVTILLTSEPRSLESAQRQAARRLEQQYRTHGVDRIDLGQSAGVLVDRRDSACFVFNDTYGADRIFVHVDGERTFFASEAKAILAVAPRTRALSAQGLAELVACGGTLGRTSLFEHIDVLQGGTVLTFRRGAEPSSRPQFDRRSLESADAMSAAEFLAEFPGQLKSSVSHCMNRFPNAAISLTGGLDSRMILACLEPARTPVPCYTFGSMYRDTFDVSIGREVAARLGQPFHVLELGNDFLKDLGQTLDRSVYISDGYLGLSGAAELYVNQKARTIAPVRVTGNWGGELLRGVRAFKYVSPREGFLLPHLTQRIQASAETFSSADKSTKNPLSYTLFHQLPVQGYGRNAIERSQVMIRSPFLDDDVVRTLYRAPDTVRGSHHASLAVIAQRPTLLDPATDLGLLGTSTGLARTARRYQRLAMAKGEYLVSHGAPDWMAALTSSRWGGGIERLFLGQHKFQHFRRWMRRDVSTYVRDTLFDSQSALVDWLDVTAVRKMTESHIAGTGNFTDELDKALTLAVTERTLLRPGSFGSPETVRSRVTSRGGLGLRSEVRVTR